MGINNTLAQGSANYVAAGGIVLLPLNEHTEGLHPFMPQLDLRTEFRVWLEDLSASLLGALLDLNHLFVYGDELCTLTRRWPIINYLVNEII